MGVMVGFDKLIAAMGHVSRARVALAEAEARLFEAIGVSGQDAEAMQRKADAARCACNLARMSAERAGNEADRAIAEAPMSPRQEDGSAAEAASWENEPG